MNEALEQAAEKALVELIDIFVKTKDFAIEQAPEIVRQLLTWNMAYYAITFSIGIALLGLAGFLIKKAMKDRSAKIKSAREDRGNGEEWTKYTPTSQHTSNAYDFIMVTGGADNAIKFICGLICLIVGLVNLNLTWIKIWLAPKVWLIEYAANLVK